MEKLKLNETPVRTSRNYNMNNIKLENIEIPAKIPSFNNVQITGNNSKVSIDSQTSKINLKYGLNKKLLEQLDLYANQKLKLTIDNKTNKETIINFKLDEKEPILLDNIEINANEQTNATVIIKYETTKNVKTFHNAVIRTNAKKDANINIILINLVNLSTDNFISIQNNFEENSRINYTIVDFGGKNSITNYYSNLVGDNSDNQMNVVYLGRENQLFDLNYIGELRDKKTNNKPLIGFSDREEVQDNESYTITPEDLIDLGFERELVGRFNVYLHTDEYSKESLLRILKESTISPLIGFKRWINSRNKKLIIEDGVYETIAESAYDLNTGARSLQTVMNNIRTPFLKEVLRGKEDTIYLDVDTVKKITEETVKRKVRK